MGKMESIIDGPVDRLRPSGLSDMNHFTVVMFCARSRCGKWFQVRRKTARKRLRATLAKMKEVLRRRMHDPIPEVGAWLQRVVLGYYQYHAIPGNCRALSSFRYATIRHWLAVLKRRGQKRRMNWKGFGPIVRRWIPVPTIVHPHPNVRFDAKHPR
jgi:RNA-directed DNA polymerase